MIRRLIDNIHRFNAARELRTYAPKISDASENLSPKELVDFIYSEKWARFFWIKQEYSEILSLCEKVNQLKPKIVLEIGTAQGGSLFLFTKLADPNAIIISIDLPKGDFGGGYEEYKGDFYKTFVGSNQKMHLFREDSHAEIARKKVESIIGDRKIDFLFIDGDHTYDGVKSDYLLYSPLVSKTGLIGFHDIVASTKGCEVRRFWEETKADYSKSIEFVGSPHQNFCGVGLVSPQDRIA
jgi:cephalosporin hydroxylase